jgi:hypothetical protein
MHRGEGRKGVSGAGGYFMGYYTIWLASVKRDFVPFWESQKMGGVAYGRREPGNVPSVPTNLKFLLPFGV